MYRPDNTHTPRYEIAKNTPKDVRIDMGVLDAAYLNRLLTLPKLEGTPEFLKHNPREFSDRCIIRYRIQDSKFNSPRQPDPRLSTHRRRYG